MRKYRLGRGQPWSRWGPGGQTDSSRDWAIDRRQEVCWLAVYISFHFAGQPPPETGPVTPSPTSESSLIKPDKGGDALEGATITQPFIRLVGRDGAPVWLNVLTLPEAFEYSFSVQNRYFFPIYLCE